MKHNLRNRGFLLPTILVLLSTTMCFAMGAPPQGPSGHSFMEFLPAIMLLLIIFLVPTVKAYLAAKKAEKFKALVFATIFFEWVGWIICITIIGIPFGLALILAGQSARVLIEIEKNTSETRMLLKQNLKIEL